MSSEIELEPCPHCGAQAEYVFKRGWHGKEMWCVACCMTANVAADNDDRMCRCRTPFFKGKDAKRKAATVWNRRAERTCHMTKVRDGLARGWWKCSECGGVAPAPDEFSYCPNCGARVVYGDKDYQAIATVERVRNAAPMSLQEHESYMATCRVMPEAERTKLSLEAMLNPGLDSELLLKSFGYGDDGGGR